MILSEPSKPGRKLSKSRLIARLHGIVWVGRNFYKETLPVPARQVKKLSRSTLKWGRRGVPLRTPGLVSETLLELRKPAHRRSNLSLIPQLVGVLSGRFTSPKRITRTR